MVLGATLFIIVRCKSWYVYGLCHCTMLLCTIRMNLDYIIRGPVYKVSTFFSTFLPGFSSRTLSSVCTHILYEQNHFILLFLVYTLSLSLSSDVHSLDCWLGFP